MKKIELVIRAEDLEPLKKILDKYQYCNLTVVSAMSCDHQKSTVREAKRLGIGIDLLPRLYVMAVVWDGDLDDILAQIVANLPHNAMGHGTIVVSTVEDIVHFRKEGHDKSLP